MGHGFHGYVTNNQCIAGGRSKPNEYLPSSGCQISGYAALVISKWELYGIIHQHYPLVMSK
jgi:hypothetical protein